MIPNKGFFGKTFTQAEHDRFQEKRHRGDFVDYDIAYFVATASREEEDED